MTPIRLLVVDDHSLFRRGLIALLTHDARFHIVGEAADASSAQRSAAQLQPDVILLDNLLPGVMGVDAIAGLKEAAPNARILMLTVSEDENDLAAGLHAGADGYLLKTIDTADLANSIVQVWDGETIISPDMMGKLVGLLRDAPRPGMPRDVKVKVKVNDIGSATAHGEAVLATDPIHNLSPREKEILRLIARGDSNKMIARELEIAETTVKIHVQHILRKLNLINRVHAAVYAAERGWLAS